MSSWEMKSIDELATVGRGRSKHRPRNDPALYGGSYPFVQTADIHASDLYINSFSKTYSDLGLAQSKLWEPGILCITNAGENTGDCAILDIEACFPDSIIAVKPDPEKADVFFLKYSVDRIKHQLRGVTKGATQDNLSVSKLVSFKFPVPPLTTQKRIGETLRSYGDLIENNRRRIQLLEESARLLYKEWFVHLRFPGHEHVTIHDGIPDGWKLGTVADLGTIVTGKTPSKKDSGNFGGNIPFVKTPDMHHQLLIIDTEETLSERGANTQIKKNMPRGSVMVSCIGTVGVVSIATRTCQTNQQINTVIPHDLDHSPFIFFALSQLKPHLEAMGGGATMANVNKTKFSSVPVLIPSRKLLSAFCESVQTTFSQIETLSMANRKLAQARDILLPRLMNGEIAA